MKKDIQHTIGPTMDLITYSNRRMKVMIDRLLKPIAMIVALSMIVEVAIPVVSMALTNGPSQPEFNTFTPIGVTDMVDPFTGAFTYNIPLLDVDGFPVNIAYHSGVTMDAEASWVGLGWDLNLGTIKHDVRGISDDFNGEDQITKESNIKENKTWGVKTGFGLEILGLKKGKSHKHSTPNLSLDFTFGIFKNSYTGLGFETGSSVGISGASKGGAQGSLSLGLGYSSQDGISPSINASLSGQIKHAESAGDVHAYSAGGSVSAGYSSRSGLKAIAFSASATRSKPYQNSSGEDKSHTENSFNGNSTIPLGTQSYTPQVQMPMTSTSGSVRVTVGGEVKTVHMHGSVEGYFSKQKLASQTQVNPAYGYFYAQNAVTPDALIDMNREKDGNFTENTPNLPVTNFTYDVYSASGHGVSGMFRPCRSDIGVLFDPEQVSGGDGTNFGAEIGLGDLLHVGVNTTFNYSHSQSSKWWADNDANAPYGFMNPGTPLHEIFYFKEAGEKTIGDQSFDQSIGGEQPVRVAIVDHKALSILQTNDGTPVNIAPVVRTHREKRQQVMTALTAREAQFAGLSKRIENYPINDFDISSGRYRTYEYIDRVNLDAKPHHISEMTVLKSDGSRYVYGVPAYNRFQKEVTFNIAPRNGNGDGNCETGLVSYDPTGPNADNSVNNTRGIDNYFNSTAVPPYAHSYLLTAVLSPDYHDRTGDGVTDDDAGSAVRINYDRQADSYNWRVPFQENRASFNEGLRSNKNDDKGSYLYGSRENWYVHSIVTKTHVAEFYISMRHDGFGVKDENGGLDRAAADGPLNSSMNKSKALFKLDSIKLFSKEDRIRNGSLAEPVKTVHFEYDYSLCQGVPNNDSTLVGQYGKLTLVHLYFTYGNLPKGRMNAYEFRYLGLNPNYNLKGSDRWCNYKKNQPLCANANDDISSSSYRLANPDDPYVEQDEATANANASAWELTQIVLPSKGLIDITYESADYAYVQNRRAMRMMTVAGVANFFTDGPSNKLYDLTPLQNNLWVAFDLPAGITSSQQLYDKCIAGQTDALHFRFLVDITGSGDYEYVSGYCGADPSSVAVTPGLGWIKLNPTGLHNDGTGDLHPIAKAAMQMARLNMNSKIYPASDPASEGSSAIKGLLSFIMDVKTMAQGIYPALRSKGFCQKMVPGKSWIRLMEPSMRRFGGGTRVRRIETSDNWKIMTGGSSSTAQDAFYGQEYTYTMSGNEPRTADDISSGVASYEPSIGGDENPFHEPVPYSNEHFMAPNDQFYMEKPFGEAHFPDPCVGYRKVTTRNIYDHLKHTATGKVVDEFYTALDFPVRATQTDPVVHRTKPSFLDGIFKARSIDNLTASQGYAIIKNDMHGKPKAKWTFAEGATSPLSGVQYFYRTDPNDPSKLLNNVTVIDDKGHVATETVGRDIDMTLDMRQTASVIRATDVTTNVDGFTLAIFPPFLPSLWKKTTNEKTRFRSAVVTKAIYQYGILDSVVAHEDGATVSTENIARDAETGEVLLTRTSNTFHDPIYNFTYAAHWYYDGMGSAYRNVGAHVSSIGIGADGIATIANAENFLTSGDEVLLTIPNSTQPGIMGWILTVWNGQAMFVDRVGKKIDVGTYDLLVVRSGRRNLPATSIGTVTSLYNPLATNKISLFNRVINADAIEYWDKWKTDCGVGKIGQPCTLVCDTNANAMCLEIQAFLNYLAHHEGITTQHLDLNTVTPPLTNMLAMGGAAGVHAYNHTGAGGTGALTPGVGGLYYFDLYLGTKHCRMEIEIPKTRVSPWNNINQITSFSSIRPDHSPTWPGYGTDFLIDANVAPPSSDPFTVTLHGSSECAKLVDCHLDSCAQVDCGIKPGDVVNPFVSSLWGDWRKARSHAFLVDRQPLGSALPADSRRDGPYAMFKPFWIPPSGNIHTWHPATANWTWTSQVTKFSPYGFELENKDALGRFSGALYGYANTVPTAVAANARFESIAFDGFEDYSIAGCGRECVRPRHWDFQLAGSSAILDDAVSHTGRFSLRLEPGTSASVVRNIEPECTQRGALPDITKSVLNLTSDKLLELDRDAQVHLKKPPQTSTSTMHIDEGSVTIASMQAGLSAVVPELAEMQEYLLNSCDCNGLFSPEPGKTYVFSGWTKQALTPPQFTGGHASVEISTGGVSSSITLQPDGSIVEGWQHVEGTFTIPTGATNLSVKLNNTSAVSGPVYFDDLRIHPFDATLKTYVFDAYTLRLMAILDERNYASIYEYNYEGQLTRLKKETERGIVTVQTSDSDLSKH